MITLTPKTPSQVDEATTFDSSDELMGLKTVGGLKRWFRFPKSLICDGDDLSTPWTYVPSGVYGKSGSTIYVEFRKNRNGEVELFVGCNITAGSSAESANVVLPTGFLTEAPVEGDPVCVGALVNENGQSVVVEVNDTGTISVYAPDNMLGYILSTCHPLFRYLPKNY